MSPDRRNAGGTERNGTEAGPEDGAGKPNGPVKTNGRRSGGSGRPAGAVPRPPARKRRGGLPPRGFTGHRHRDVDPGDFPMGQTALGSIIQ